MEIKTAEIIITLHDKKLGMDLDYEAEADYKKDCHGLVLLSLSVKICGHWAIMDHLFDYSWQWDSIFEQVNSSLIEGSV